MCFQGSWSVNLKVILLISPLCGGSSGQYPSVPCPNTFEYAKAGNKHIGLITVGGVTDGETKVEIELSQSGSVHSDFLGALSLNFEKDRFSDYLSSGRPIKYKVDFPLQDVTPRVSSIRINGDLVCSGEKVPLPSATFIMEHTLTALTDSTSSSTAQMMPLPSVTSNSNLTRFYIPKSMRDAYDQQIIRLSFKDVVFLVAPTPTSITTTPIAPNQASLSYINSICGVASVRQAFKKRSVREPSEFPWIATIFKEENGSYIHQCGGNLISARTVITVAHCVYNIRVEDLRAYLGNTLNLTNRSSRSSHINSYGVEQLIKHPDYKQNIPDADLALMQLKDTVTFSIAIKPICLWQETSVGAVGEIGTILSASGVPIIYGSIPSKAITATIVSDLICIRSNLNIVRLTSNRTFCAGNHVGSGPCFGDSGNGLMMHRGSQWQLRGILSTGIFNHDNTNSRCFSEEYLIYTDVAKFTEWIQTNMFTMRDVAPTPTSITTTPIAPNQASLSYINSICGVASVRQAFKKRSVREPSEFPWIATIFKEENGSYIHQCGGNLISARTVITVAHCVYNIRVEDLRAYLGNTLNLTNRSSRSSHINSYGVEQLIKHPDYKQIIPDADLALMQLKDRVTFSIAIQPICLWQETSVGAVGEIGTILSASGVPIIYGSIPSKAITATIVSDLICIRSNLNIVRLTSNRTFCAGNHVGSGPCFGDSGNGLMMHRGSQWQLRGILSTGIFNHDNTNSRCFSEEYLIYTDVAKFTEWIQSTMLL